MCSGCLQLWPTSLWASRCSNTLLPSGTLPSLLYIGLVWMCECAIMCIYHNTISCACWKLNICCYFCVVRKPGAFAQIFFRVVLIDVVQFGIIFLILLYAFSGALYLALRGEGLSPSEQAAVRTDSNSSAVPGTPTSLDISPLETS